MLKCFVNESLFHCVLLARQSFSSKGYLLWNKMSKDILSQISPYVILRLLLNASGLWMLNVFGFLFSQIQTKNLSANPLHFPLQHLPLSLFCSLQTVRTYHLIASWNILRKAWLKSLLHLQDLLLYGDKAAAAASHNTPNCACHSWDTAQSVVWTVHR